MRLPVAREGLPFIILALGLLAIAWWFTQDRGGWVRSLPWLAAVLALFVAYFFRDPQRAIPSDPSLVLSPADGKVIEIRTVDEPAFLGGKGQRVTIFLSIFNVHVQRSPVDGTVDYYQYHPGGYAVAWHEKASEENERANLGISHSKGRVVVTQIAGLIARRIVTYPRPGDTVERGQRIGLIRFGSRVDLIVPMEWTVTTKVGDVVAGGTSVLAEIPATRGTPDGQ